MSRTDAFTPNYLGDLETNHLEPVLGPVLITGASSATARWFISVLSTAWEEAGHRGIILLVGRDPVRLRTLYAEHQSRLDCYFADYTGLEELFHQHSPHLICHFAAHTSATVSSDTERQAFFADSFITTLLVDQASSLDSPPRLLYSSSGAIYGRQRMNPDPPHEQDGSTSDDEKDHPYDRSKKLSEHILRAAGRAGVIRPCIARMYSFVGPLLPLDQHYAIGNFILDAHNKRSVRLSSSGKDWRSWMFMGDLGRALHLLAASGECGVFNVGSTEYMTIRDAAQLVAIISGQDVLNSVQPSETQDPTFYYPNMTKFNESFVLSDQLSLADSIRSTLIWLQSQHV